MNDPKVSVILATWNAAATLPKCLNSIRGQSYPNIELIVMDGGSDDKTQEVLEQNSDIIAYWESRKDNGIYHAWNKALKHATGEWICFIGADDCWAYSNAVQDMINECTDAVVNLISGKVALIDEQGREKSTYGRPWSWDKTREGNCIAIVGALFHNSLFSAVGSFDESYRIAGDYEFTMRMGHLVESRFVDKVIVNMGDSGVSRAKVLSALEETWDIQRKHADIGFYKATYNFLRSCIIITIKKALGKF